MARAELALVVALALGGCSPLATPRPYAWIRNGGLGSHAAACEEIALRIEEPVVRVVAPQPTGCTEEGTGLAADVGAAYAYAQTASAAVPAGPIVSNPVELGVIGLASGAADRGLGGGAADRGLAGGAGDRGLVSGADERALASGADERGLAGGADERGLAAGADERGPVGGAGERGLVGGAGERALDVGASERTLESGAAERPQWQLRKRVTPETIAAADVAEFTLTFVNDGTSPVERLLIVDRVDPALRIESAPGARAFVLEDGSTLLVWEDRAPLAPRRQRSVSFTAVLRAAPGEP